MVGEGFRYEQLGDHHLPLRRHFRCGQEALDVYLRSKRAWKEQEDDVAAVRVIYDPIRDRIAGYYTLSAYYIQRVLLPEERTQGKPNYEEYPATLLGRMARDEEYAEQRIGERLLLDALKRSLEASKVVASFALVVDAKTPNVENFYQKYDFQRLETERHERRYSRYPASRVPLSVTPVSLSRNSAAFSSSGGMWQRYWFPA